MADQTRLGSPSNDNAHSQPIDIMVEVDDDGTTSQLFYEVTSYEVDENNVIRGLHSDKVGERRPAIEDVPPILPPDQENLALNQRGANWQPIVQRAERDITIGIDEFKRPLVLHDLKDEDNVSVMVINGDHTILQGHHQEVRATIQALFESQGERPEENILVSIQNVFGESAAKKRQAARRYSLVDIKKRYKVMERKRADRLMDKDWLDPNFDGLVVAELQPADPSPTGALKPGRRLVPIESEEESIGLRQAQFSRGTKEDSESAETQMTGYTEVLANKTWLG